MIWQDWKVSSPFFLRKILCYRSGKFRWKIWKIPHIENLAENLASGKISGKSGGSCKAENLAENLENLTRKICGKFPQSGKSGKSADPVQLRKICGKIGKSGKSENVKYI